MTRVRVAVVGLGAISQSVHLPLLRRNADQFEIAALVDLSAERAADMGLRYGVSTSRQFTSIAALLSAVTNGRLVIDAAIVATTGTHSGAVLEFVKANVKVLAEKPLAYSTAEIDALEEHATHAGIDLRDWIRVGYMKEYDEATLRAKDALAGKTLRAVAVQVLHPLDGSQLAFARLASPTSDVDAAELADAVAPTTVAVDAALGTDTPDRLRTLYTNVVLGSIVHDIGVLRATVGGLGAVHSASHWGSKMPGSIHVRGELAEGGVPVSIDWHYIDSYPDYRETVTFHHETGTVELEFGVPYVLNLPTVLRVTDAEPNLGIRVSEARWMQQEAFETEHFALAALVRGERPNGAGAAESVSDVQVGQRIIRALAESCGHDLDPGVEAAQVPPQ